MLKNIVSFIEKHFNTIAIALLVPLGGLWLNYMQEARQAAQSQRQWIEGMEDKHENFSKEISSYLKQNELGFMDQSSNLLTASIVINELAPIADQGNVGTGYSQQQLEDFRLLIRQSKSLTPKQRSLFNYLKVRLQSLISASRLGKIYSQSESMASSAKIKETLEFLHGLGLMSGAMSILFQVDMSDLNLSESRLACLNMKAVTMSNTNLGHSELSSSNILWFLDGVDLQSANLDSSRIMGSIKNSSFKNAYLPKVSFHDVEIYATNFEGASLIEASLYDTELHGASIFKGADLRGADLRVKNYGKRNQKFFKGGYANTEQINMSDGTIIPTTILPKNQSLSSLGLIEWNKEDAPPSVNKGKFYAFAAGALVPKDCLQRIDLFHRLIIQGRSRSHS